MSEFRFPRPVQRVVARFARVVCPPALARQDVMEGLLSELQAMVGAMPVHVRLALTAGFAAFEQGARVYPAARGRAFTALDDEAALAYFQAAAHGPVAASRKVLQLMKGLVTMAYYEQPQVLAELEYHPDAYIAEVARRRLQTYGDEIARAEAAVTVDDVVVQLGRKPAKEAP